MPDHLCQKGGKKCGRWFLKLLKKKLGHLNGSPIIKLIFRVYKTETIKFSFVFSTFATLEAVSPFMALSHFLLLRPLWAFNNLWGTLLLSNPLRVLFFWVAYVVFTVWAIVVYKAPIHNNKRMVVFLKFRFISKDLG